MYTALYRRYRPGTFDEMVGQEHIVKILKNQIRTGNTAHAYLFCGTRGTGKTSAARIFAKGVNCLSLEDKPCGICENCISIQQGVFFDVIEIDAASNNRVDNIRELRESVKYPPAAGLCKVYIIDEVHMLSTGAFNALLKTLEEPPEHVIFILATTEPHKLPATILSRCLRLDFRRVPEARIEEKLREICQEQNIEFENSALALIAANGDGSVRDALSILEQCIPVGEHKLMRKDVVDILGTAGEETLIDITSEVAKGNASEAFLIIEKLARDGKDIRQFIKDWTFHFRNLMMAKFADKLEDIMNMSCENAEKVREQGKRLEIGFITAAITELSATGNKARYSTQPRTLLELSILKLANPEISDGKEALIQRIEKLEAYIKEGFRGEGHDEEKMIPQTPSPASETEELPPWIVDEAEELINHSYENEAEFVMPEGFETNSKSIASQKSEEKKPDKSDVEEQKEISEEYQNSAENTDAGREIPGASEGSEVSEESRMPEEPKPEASSLWDRAFALALKEKPSLRILADDAKVSKTEGNQIRVTVGSLLKKNMLAQNKSVVEKHLKSLSGEDYIIQINVADSSANTTAAPSLEETKRQLEQLLGADKLTITK